MLSFADSLFLDSILLQSVNLESLLNQSLSENSFGLCGKPNRPNRPWRDSSLSDGEKVSVDISGEVSKDCAEVTEQTDYLTGNNSLGVEITEDALLGSTGYEYLSEMQGDRSISDKDSVFITPLVDTDKNLTDGQDSIAWTEPQSIGMQQQSRHTFSSLGGDPLMQFANLDPTVWMNAMSLV